MSYPLIISISLFSIIYHLFVSLFINEIFTLPPISLIISLSIPIYISPHLSSHSISILIFIFIISISISIAPILILYYI